MWYISANRDESVFDDPFRFDTSATPVSRWRSGAGTTSASAPTWRMELQLIFREVLERIPTCAPSPQPRSCARISSAASAHAGGVHPGRKEAD